MKNIVARYVPTDLLVTRSDSYCEGYAIGQMVEDMLVNHKDKRFSTELISMGAQYMATPKKALDLYRKDKEHFLFVLGVMKK
jgi:hypothetical protein